jgi:hypothetical protein
MTTFLKVVVAAVALSAGASSLAEAFPAEGGIEQACQAHDYTPHGVWDCR